MVLLFSTIRSAPTPSWHPARLHIAHLLIAPATGTSVTLRSGCHNQLHEPDYLTQQRAPSSNCTSTAYDNEGGGVLGLVWDERSLGRGGNATVRSFNVGAPGDSSTSPSPSDPPSSPGHYHSVICFLRLWLPPPLASYS